MKIVILDNYILMSAQAADIVIETIADKPNCVLALPTGRTPIGMYQELTEEFKQGELSFQGVTTFNLDNYVGLPNDHPASFNSFMKQNFFDLVDLKKENIFMLDGNANDLVWVCDDYERSINEKGGLDLVILGIGTEGHIAFNEAGTAFDSETHVMELRESSRQASQGFQNIDEVPKKAITMGIGTIMSARQILLLANGAHKKAIMKKVLHGPITPEVPASILQRHPNVVVIMDKEATP